MKIFILLALFSATCFGQYQEGTITRTFGTNSVYPRQFPEMTIRKMNDKEYWLFESLGTNTIFHRQFPTYIVRAENYGSRNQKWGVYKTIGTNSVYPKQFPDRYISDFNTNETTTYQVKSLTLKEGIAQRVSEPVVSSSYTYSKSLREDKRPSYNPESPE
jgi:hypothetical protein